MAPCCVGSLAFVRGVLLYHSASMGGIAVINPESLSLQGVIPFNGSGAVGPLTFGSIADSVAALGPDVAPLRPVAMSVDLPTAVESGEAEGGGPAVARPEVSDDDVQKCAMIPAMSGYTVSQAISRMSGCVTCGMSFPPVSTLGALENVFIEGPSCGCPVGPYCPSCCTVIQSTGGDSTGYCQNCGGSNTIPVFALFEYLRRNENMTDDSPIQVRHSGGFGMAKIPVATEEKKAATITTTVSSTIITSDGSHLYALSWLAPASVDGEEKASTVEPTTALPAPVSTLPVLGLGAAQPFPSRAFGDEFDEDEYDEDAQFSFGGSVPYNPFSQPGQAFPNQLMAAAAPVATTAAAVTTTAAAGVDALPQFGTVAMHALCPDKGFAVVKQLTLKRQLSETQALSVPAGLSTGGIYFPELAVSGDFTFETWVRFEKVETNAKSKGIQEFHLLALGVAGSPISLTLKFKAKKLHFGADANPQSGQPGMNVCEASITANTLTTWTHVALVYSSGSCAVYINGQQLGTGTPVGSTFACNSVRLFGKNNMQLRGFVCNTRLWKVARTHAEIRDAMKIQLPEDALLPSLVGNWLLNEGTGPTVLDSAPAANHAQQSGLEWLPSVRPADPLSPEQLVLPVQFGRGDLYTSSIVCDGRYLLIDTLPKAKGPNRLFRVRRTVVELLCASAGTYL